MAMVKNEKKKKPWWKKLIIFLAVILVIYLIFHFAFAYFSNVICENLSSIAESEQYIKKGNEKIKLGAYFEDIDSILNQSLELSKLAYEPESKDESRKEELEKLGYENVMQYNNKPSQLYKHLAKKNKNASIMMSAVNATVATKQLDGGETLIAVAFKGTDSSNINDDLSDMYKAVDDNGFHKGFMFNAKQFDKKADKIEFTIDNKKVTLSQILEEMKKDDCKYKMLVTGHSLGAAVADIYSGYILKNEGINDNNIVTVTYGTPKSCAKDFTYSGNNIVNIINTDDMVPTIGAENHLGTCLYFTPSESFRKTNYKEHYVTPNAYNSYSDLTKTVESSLVAHNLVFSYTPLVSELEKEHSKYFIED